MADTDYALPEVIDDRDYARQFEQAQLADRRRQVAMAAADKNRQQRLSRADRQQQNDAASGLSVASGVQAAARSAYTRVWQLAEEGVQDFAYTFADLMLISGPAAVGLFMIRVLFGNVLNGAGTITFREVSVPRVPGYSVQEASYRFGKLILIGLFSGFMYSIIFMLVILIANPDLILKIGLCSVFNGVLSFFGSDVCSL